MHILTLPSLFPTKVLPKAGIFILEQTQLLASAFPQHRFSILSWSPEQYKIDLRVPRTFLNLFRPREEREISLAENLILFERPSLSWNRKLGGHLSAYRQCLKFIKEQEKKGTPVDLLHVHFGYPAGVIASEIKARTGLPYLITEHMGPFPFEHLKTGRRLVPELQAAYSNAGKVLSVSNFQKKQMELFGIHNAEVVPNFVDESLFKPTHHESNEVFRYLYVGSLIKSKGIYDLIEATKRLIASGKSFTVQVIGNGSELSNIKELIKKEKLEDIVRLHGDIARDELIPFFQNCDAFVLPSHIESFGIVYLEAMACGKPVIATANGGPKDFVTPESGILVPPKDPQALTSAMTDIIETKRFSSDNIRKNFLDNYSSTIITRKVFEMYEALINQHSKSYI